MVAQIIRNIQLCIEHIILDGYEDYMKDMQTEKIIGETKGGNPVKLTNNNQQWTMGLHACSIRLLKYTYIYMHISTSQVQYAHFQLVTPPTSMIA